MTKGQDGLGKCPTGGLTCTSDSADCANKDYLRQRLDKENAAHGDDNNDDTTDTAINSDATWITLAST